VVVANPDIVAPREDGLTLEPGDVITEAAGQPVVSKDDLAKTLETSDPDRGVLLILERSDSSAFAILKF
jgi:CTP:molybdopterin cytidylyltransferase MocA